MCSANSERKKTRKGSLRRSLLNSRETASEAHSALTDGDYRIAELSTRRVAQNNQLVVSFPASNPYLAQRIYDTTNSHSERESLFEFQAAQLQQNGLVLDFLASKYNGVIKATDRILSDSPPSLSAHTHKASVLNAAAHAQGQLAKLGLKRILPLLEKRPTDIGLVLTIIQLYVLTNNYGSAINVLESLITNLSESTAPADQDVLFAPGLIVLQVSLYTSQGRKSQIKATLAKAASYWRHRPKPPIKLLQAAGMTLLDSSDPDHMALARDIFDTLHEQDPNSKVATAGHVAAHALTSPDKVADEANTLTAVNRLIAGIDIDTLESAGIPSLPSAENARKRALDGKSEPVKKRVRKNKLPKDYDPSKKPDPERWLPQRDRSTYRPKGRKGRQKAAEKTQGGISSEKVAESKTSGGEGVIKAAEKPGGGQAKGKKKKGKK